MLNEASRIEAALASVEAQAAPWDIIVVDGGSIDDTVVKCQGRATVLQSPPGRARQMNAGWRAARGDAVLFLHADTTLPEDAFVEMRECLADSSVEGGVFRLRFDVRHPALGLFSYCARMKLASLCFGDRGIFVRRQVLLDICGFTELPIFEDLQLCRSLQKRGGFRFLTNSVTTSSRRFLEHGVLRHQFRNFCLWLGYWIGVDPSLLARRYATSDTFRAAGTSVKRSSH